MTKSEYLLIQLGEEGSEIAHIVSKCVRFGPDDHYKGTSNLEKLKGELNDFLAVIQVLEAEEILLRGFQDTKLIAKKRKKIAKWLQYSTDKGIVKS